MPWKDELHVQPEFNRTELVALRQDPGRQRMKRDVVPAGRLLFTAYLLEGRVNLP